MAGVAMGRLLPQSVMDGIHADGDCCSKYCKRYLLYVCRPTGMFVIDEVEVICR